MILDCNYQRMDLRQLCSSKISMTLIFLLLLLQDDEKLGLELELEGDELVPLYTDAACKLVAALRKNTDAPI
jgi:hypothetical protein